MAKTKNVKFWKGFGASGILILYLLVSVQNVVTALQNCFLNFNTCISYNPEVLHLDMCTVEFYNVFTKKHR